MKKIFNHLGNENGFSLISSLILFVFVTLMAASVVEISSADSIVVTNDYQKNRATYVAQAGLEWGKYRISNGLSPNVTNKYFSTSDPNAGKFTVAYNSTAQSLTSTAVVGNAKVAESTTLAAQGSETLEIVAGGNGGSCLSATQNDINFGPDYGALYDIYIKKDVVTNPNCAKLASIGIDRIGINNLKGTQQIVQVLFDGRTAATDDHFNKYGLDYENYKAATPWVGATISKKLVDLNDVVLPNTATHTLTIYIDYTLATDRPGRGDTFSIDFYLNDGSKYNEVQTY